MNKKQNNKAFNGNVNKNIIFMVGTVLVAAAALFSLFGPKPSAPPSAVPNSVTVGGDLTIVKSDITEEASFYPYESNGTYMEVVAVRASDGSVRTALNTCQVCYKSGKGYYEQKGSNLVCKNCGNRFTIDQIELTKGGCNPVPITTDLKTEDAEKVVISSDILTQAEPFFAVWNKQ